MTRWPVHPRREAELLPATTIQDTWLCELPPQPVVLCVLQPLLASQGPKLMPNPRAILRFEKEGQRYVFPLLLESATVISPFISRMSSRSNGCCCLSGAQSCRWSSVVSLVSEANPQHQLLAPSHRVPLILCLKTSLCWQMALLLVSM